jgi:Zn-dependent protease
MAQGFRVGRVAGIPIRATWSLVAILALVALALATGLLHTADPSAGIPATVLAAVLVAAGFAATIVVHELGHALVARRLGMRVEGIVLWALGGFTMLGGEATSPGRELALSAVGPAASLAAGGALVGLAEGLHGLGAPALLVVGAAWLGGLNLLLGGLNLLPAAPLDGGKVLHALIWKTRGDPLAATRASTRAGQVLGGALLVAGALALLGGVLAGLWLAASGWFVAAGATAERRQALVRASLGGVTVDQVMTPAGPPSPDWETVQHALDTGTLHPLRPVVLLEAWQGGLSGVATYPQALAVPLALRAVTRLRDVAWPASSLLHAEQGERLTDLLARWDGRPGFVLVHHDGRPVGLLAATDLALLAAAAERGVPPLLPPMAPGGSAPGPAPASWAQAGTDGTPSGSAIPRSANAIRTTVRRTRS